MKNKVKHIVLICIGSLLMTGTVAVAQGDALSAAISKTRQIKSSPIVQSRAKSKVVMETATVQNSDTQFKDIRNETRLYVQSLSNKRIAEIIKSLGATRLFLESSNATQSRDQKTPPKITGNAVQKALQSYQNRNLANSQITIALLNLSR